MKYIEVTVKSTGKKITIMEGEFNVKLYEKEYKKPVQTKELKTEKKTKAKVITSASINENKD